jgi:hypothetical protein
VEEDAAQLTDEELDRLDREEPVDGLDRESAPEDTDDGQLQVWNKFKLVTSKVL